jgi:transposase
MPNAQVVADRFHVMKKINQELDSRRKQEKRAAEKLKTKKIREPKIKAIKNSKYPLLKRKENLNETEKKKLEEIRKVLPELGIIYEEKEKFIADRGTSWLNSLHHKLSGVFDQKSSMHLAPVIDKDF